MSLCLSDTLAKVMDFSSLLPNREFLFFFREEIFLFLTRFFHLLSHIPNLLLQVSRKAKETVQRRKKR